MLGSLASNDLLLLAGVPFAAIVLGVLFGVVLPRSRRRRQRMKGITLAAFEAGAGAPPRPTRNLPGAEETSNRSTPKHTRAVAEPTYAPPAREATGTMGAEWAPPPAAPQVPDAPRLRLETSAERPAPPMIQRPPTPLERLTPLPEAPPPLRVHKPVDGTLQFLPGRLEVVEGRELGQEIRFVRQPGAGPTEITFGRQDGNPYKHIQLHEPTVSRVHARMTYEDSHWRLTNLSRTNPISVNAASMAPENTSVLLKDGDRIEMGEVVFRFKAK